MKNRDKRIAEARNKLDVIKLIVEPFRRMLDDAEHELKKAEESFDIGEHVHVEKTCKRGCCTEVEFDGVVESGNANGSWNIRRSDTGFVHTCVWRQDMTRLNK